MNVRRSFVRLTALTVVVAMPLLGMSGIASAKSAKATAAKCAKHPNKCAKGGGGGSGGPTGPIIVTVAPNPLIETGQSEIHAIVQVETSPAFAGDPVFIYSQQLVNSCEEDSVIFYSSASGELSKPSWGSITAILDDDGNATVELSGTDCAPGASVLEADLVKAPYYTATTTIVANPPVPTTAGLTGYPNPEVETGDTNSGPNGPSGNSDVYAVFYVEDSPVYAESPVEISSAQLQNRCGLGATWSAGNDGGGNGTWGMDHAGRRRQRRVHLRGRLVCRRRLHGHRRRERRYTRHVHDRLHHQPAGSDHLIPTGNLQRTERGAVRPPSLPRVRPAVSMTRRWSLPSFGRRGVVIRHQMFRTPEGWRKVPPGVGLPAGPSRLMTPRIRCSGPTPDSPPRGRPLAGSRARPGQPQPGSRRTPPSTPR